MVGYAAPAYWLAIGTNDYGLDMWSASSFGAAYGGLLDGLHAGMPSSLIYCQTPIVRSTETANGFGNTTTDYRTAIATACATRPWAKLIDGTQIVTTAALSDGVHPTTAGQATYAAFVLAQLASTSTVAQPKRWVRPRSRR